MAGLLTVSPAQVYTQFRLRLRRTPMRASVQTAITWTVALGIVVRVLAWKFDRSLWLDEIYLALNITSRSFFELWQPLDHDQGAPIGFLLLVKLGTMIFGTSEMALRLVPLMAGIGSMALFPQVARQLLPTRAVWFATALFAFSPKLVYYSSEVKQYSSDVLLTLLLVALASPMSRRHRHWILAVAGAIAIWFSHPAAFVLAGLGTVLFSVAFWRSDEAELSRLLKVGLTWSCSFAACYFMCLRELGKNQYLMAFWTECFAPLPPANFEQCGWYLRAVAGLFEGPAGMCVADVSFAVPAVLLFGLGWSWLWQRTPNAAACLVAPIIVAMAASMLQRYPFGGRLVLFTVPLLHLGIGAALAGVCSLRHSPGRTTLLVMCACVLFAPLATTAQQLIAPRPPEDHRAAIRFIADNQQTGDCVILSEMASAPWEYYSKQAGVQMERIGQVRRDDWVSVRQTVESAAGRCRVWVYIAHARDDNRKALLWQLDQFGKCRAKFTAPGAAAYLYDLANE